MDIRRSVLQRLSSAYAHLETVRTILDNTFASTRRCIPKVYFYFQIFLQSENHSVTFEEANDLYSRDLQLIGDFLLSAFEGFAILTSEQKVSMAHGRAPSEFGFASLLYGFYFLRIFLFYVLVWTL